MSSGDGAGSVGRRASSSNNSANSCEVVKPKFGAPLVFSDDDEDLIPSTAPGPSKPVDNSWLDVDDTTTTPDDESSGRGTPPDDARRQDAEIAASASSSPPSDSSSLRDSSTRNELAEVARRNKSLRRAGLKDYVCWPVGLLRFACSRRGIARMTRENNKKVMAALLVEYDESNNRSTRPYMDDLLGACDRGEQQV